MTLWLDADACPIPIREMLFRAAVRTATPLILVANCPIRIPPGEWIHMVVVPPNPDEADDYIAEHCEAGDLVITSDIPLAARVVAAGAMGLNPRGELYTEENAESALAMRNMMMELRSNGLVQGGPSPHSAPDTQAFANALDRFLTSQKRTS